MELYVLYVLEALFGGQKDSFSQIGSLTFVCHSPVVPWSTYGWTIP
jgi:hypothetical protein